VTIITDLLAVIDPETAEIDTPKGSDRLTEDGVEAENEIIVTGETIPMTGLEDAARILLTHGPVAEEMTIADKRRTGPIAQSRAMYICPY
jgi:hypothetical protein